MEKEEWYFNPKNVIIIITFLFCSITSFYFYVCKADNHEMLGQYGDFLGGILNPLFSALSLFVLIVFVKDIEHKRAKESIKAQQLITKTQMRFDIVKELRSEMKYNRYDDFATKNTKINTSRVLIQAFIINYTFLFKDLLSDEFRETTLQPYLNSATTYTNYYLYSEANNNLDTERESQLFSLYALDKEILFRSFDEYIIRKLEEEK